MRVITTDQRTDNWSKSRLGIPSASNFNMVITASGIVSKQRDKYLYRLVGERLSGASEDSYQNPAMLRGIELEAEARDCYSFITGNEVTETGFCMHDTIDAGASPDGMIGEDGLLEIKCPSLGVATEYLYFNRLPSDYFQQVQGQLFITGREWCSFFSYFPGLKPLIVRVEPDLKFHDALRQELELLCADINTMVEKLRG